MDLLDAYLNRSGEIVGERTAAEQRYDAEVVKWLKKTGKIRKAIRKANEKYPGEALKVSDENVDEVAEHYRYLMQHMEIVRAMGQ